MTIAPPTGVIVVTGTDTGIGKTVVAAALTAALGAYYWKPIQSGTLDGTDSNSVVDLAGISPDRIVPEAVTLALPASPHLSAEAEGATIDPDSLSLPAVRRPLVVEGAGGVMVPIRRDPPWLFLDQFATWRAPVVLVARTSLGTINHSLLSIAALKSRGITVAGVIFSGEADTDNERVIPALGDVPALGRLPIIDPLTPESLLAAVHAHIDIAAIRRAMGAPESRL